VDDLCWKARRIQPVQDGIYRNPVPLKLHLHRFGGYVHRYLLYAIQLIQGIGDSVGAAFASDVGRIQAYVHVPFSCQKRFPR
jgi:hypothetical protein